MQDLISRQAAIDAICKACANGDDYVNCRDRDIKSRWCDNITALRDLPSAQPEVVRCKDCKWWDKYDEKHGYCMRVWHRGDYFCDDAERREE